MNSAPLFPIFVMGMCLGVTIGCLLCASFEQWSKQFTGWIMEKMKSRYDIE